LDDSDANSDPKAKAKLIEAVLGYMRSYNFLVRHESDYRIAVKEHLIPVTTTYEDFMIFISSFAEIKDSQVSLRYRFGELRLRRLNLWSPLLLKKTYFHKIVWQYGDYLAQYYAPYLFFFSIFSVALSAMQVGVGAKMDWLSFYGVSAWFSVATLIVVCLAILGVIGDFLFLSGREAVYAIKHKFFPRRKLSNASRKGLV
jgi:hypothetical protein